MVSVATSFYQRSANHVFFIFAKLIVPYRFDGTFYPPGMESVPRKIAIVRANRYVVDHVDYLIAYAWHPASNARALVEYAQKRQRKNGIQITVLAQVAI